MKKKGSKGRVMFNKDVTPGMTGVEKSGLGHPNIKRGAAAVKGASERTKARSRKRG